MSLNLSTRRTQTISLTANTVYEFNLDSVYQDKNIVIPNVIQIRNKNTTDIVYFDYSTMVSTTYYVQSINPLTNRKHVTSNNVSKLYFLTASNCSIEITTAYDPEPNVSDLDDTQETNVINQTLTIGNVGVSSISAGTNRIGKVYLTDGSRDAGVNSDNSLKVNDVSMGAKADDKSVVTDTTAASVISLLKGLIYILSNNPEVNIGGATINATISDVGVTSLPALPTGNNSIGHVDVDSLPALPVGSNTIGKVGIDGAIPAGDNNIGNFDIVTVASGQNLKPATGFNIYNVTCTEADTEYTQALPAGCKGFMIGIKSKLASVVWNLKFASGAGSLFYFAGNETYSMENVLLASTTLYFQSDIAGEIIQVIAWT